MKLFTLLLFAGAVLVGCNSSGVAVGDADPNTLSQSEEQAGFELLFDGESLEGWRGYKQEGPPAGWQVRDGALSRIAEGAGDLISERKFADFELRLQWKISPGGNSGIFYGATEDEDYIWQSAAEMQVLDDEGHPGLEPEHSAGANYALHAPEGKTVNPPGQWNDVRIRVQRDVVEHWLNGDRVVQFERYSPDWEERVAASKFGAMPAYGRARVGHIGIQDHGNAVAYRSIRILDLAR